MVQRAQAPWLGQNEVVALGAIFQFAVELRDGGLDHGLIAARSEAVDVGPVDGAR